jgi:hypothetical protein
MGNRRSAPRGVAPPSLSTEHPRAAGFGVGGRKLPPS